MSLAISWAIPALSADKLKCRFFRSYSYKNTEDANQFMKFFGLQLRSTPALSISMEQIFFDRGHIRAGDEWHESLRLALEDAQYFILLLSANSLSSKCCFSVELRTAIARELTIISIALNRCPWEEHAVPNDPKNRKLGLLEALPEDDPFGLRPIADWPQNNRTDAWTRVVRDPANRFVEDLAHPVSRYS